MAITTPTLDRLIVKAVELGLNVEIKRDRLTFTETVHVRFNTTGKFEIRNRFDNYVMMLDCVVYAAREVDDYEGTIGRWTHDANRWDTAERTYEKIPLKDIDHWIARLGEELVEVKKHHAEADAEKEDAA